MCVYIFAFLFMCWLAFAQTPWKGREVAAGEACSHQGWGVGEPVPAGKGPGEGDSALHILVF